MTSPTDARTRAIEVMAEEIAFQRDPSCGRDLYRMSREYGKPYRRDATAALDALLAAHTDCETCGGTSTLMDVADGPSGRMHSRVPCPACGGSGRGESVLVAMMMERAGCRTIKKAALTRSYISSGPAWTYIQSMVDGYNPDFVIQPMYVVRPVDQHEEG